MITFCIQVQPDRAPGIDIDRVRELCQETASDTSMVERHGVIEGNDEGPYLNLMFEIVKAGEFWRSVKTKLYADPLVGGAMERASMATCTGEHGWDDYLLLYHYDKGLQLDVLPNH